LQVTFSPVPDQIRNLAHQFFTVVTTAVLRRSKFADDLRLPLPVHFAVGQPSRGRVLVTKVLRPGLEFLRRGRDGQTETFVRFSRRQIFKSSPAAGLRSGVQWHHG
jgi:hypothetical protein